MAEGIINKIATWILILIFMAVVAWAMYKYLLPHVLNSAFGTEKYVPGKP